MPLKTNVLIVTSESNELNAKRVAMLYNNVVMYTPKGAFTTKRYEKALEMRKKYRNYEIVAIGGGTVIDQAKVIAYPNRCIAFPTTAAGSSVTSTATVWGACKETIQARIPIDTGLILPALLPEGVVIETSYDALSHAVESLWSRKATKESRLYATNAITVLRKSIENQVLSHIYLVDAGLFAGLAINITSTNIIHALSYPITTKYKWAHGVACALWFWGVVDYFECAYKYKVPKLPIPKGLAKLIPNVDIDWVIREALTYPKIQDGPKRVTEQDLKNIWELCHEWTKSA